MPLLPDDHIDLLVSAANDWQLLATPSTPTTLAALEAFGLSLHQANLASETAKQRIGGLDENEAQALAMAPATYTWREVTDRWEPIDVLKASHAALHACSHAPQWATSHVHRILEMLGVAAAQRLDAYEAAPWLWQRPSSTTCAIGWSADQVPPGIGGLVWVDATTLDKCWDTAVVIVLTSNALDQLDETLPCRRDIVIIKTTPDLTDNQWEVAATLGTPQIVDLQPGRAWLENLLAERSRYVHAARSA